jgi:cation transport ATPase
MADSAARSSGADITLVHGGVGAVADAVTLARATRRILRQNPAGPSAAICCS